MLFIIKSEFTISFSVCRAINTEFITIVIRIKDRNAVLSMKSEGYELITMVFRIKDRNAVLSMKSEGRGVCVYHNRDKDKGPECSALDKI